MSLFAQTKTVQQLLTIAGAVPSVGGQNVRLVIPRQSRRLQKIRLGARFNVTTALAGGADFGLGLAGLLSSVKLTVSDAAGSNRAAIDSNGATLHCQARRIVVTTSRLVAMVRSLRPRAWAASHRSSR